MNLLKVKYISIYNRYFCFYVIIGVLSSIALNFRDIELKKKSCWPTPGLKDDLGFQNELSKMTIKLIKLLGSYILLFDVHYSNKQWSAILIGSRIFFDKKKYFICLHALKYLINKIKTWGGNKYYISIFLYKSS